MTIMKRILFFFVLPILGWLSYSPALLARNITPAGLGLVGLVILLFIGLGFLLQRGKSLALTLAIFLQGLNVIVRLMMLFPNAYRFGAYDIPYVLMNLIGMGISFYLMLRLDKTDVRVWMVT
jgi:hypothetical protein